MQHDLGGVVYLRGMSEVTTGSGAIRLDDEGQLIFEDFYIRGHSLEYAVAVDHGSISGRLSIESTGDGLIWKRNSYTRNKKLELVVTCDGTALKLGHYFVGSTEFIQNVDIDLICYGSETHNINVAYAGYFHLHCKRLTTPTDGSSPSIYISNSTNGEIYIYPSYHTAEVEKGSGTASIYIEYLGHFTDAMIAAIPTVYSEMKLQRYVYPHPMRSDVKGLFTNSYGVWMYENRGNDVMGAGVDYIDVAHDLPETPEMVFITSEGEEGGAAWVSDFGATTFRINVPTTTSSGAAFNWWATTSRR